MEENHNSEIAVEKPEQKVTRKSFKGRLGRALFVWFLLLAVIPLTIVSVVSYKTTSNNISQLTIQQLKVVAQLKAKNIKSYFHDQLNDLEFHSKTNSNVNFIIDLKSAFKESNKSLAEFVKSYQYAKMTRETGQAGDLAHLRDDLEYYDVWLIDDEFNVLFAVSREDELGTNLKTGKLKGTLLARKAEEALNSGLPRYTDLQHHEHTDYFAGFLIQLLVDDIGERVGLLLFQIEARALNDIMQDRIGLGRTGESYLVGPDSLLRSDPVQGKEGLILNINEKVETDIIKIWHREHILEDHGEEAHEEETETVQDDHYQEEKVNRYIGRNGLPVIGVVNHLEVAGIPMAVVAEIESSEALQSVESLRKIVQGMFVITIVLVLIIAFFVTRRIVGPLQKLSLWAVDVSKGDLEEKIIRVPGNEIGALSASFQRVVQSFQEVSEVCSAITKGDFSQRVEVKGEKDLLGKSVNRMAESLHSSILEIDENSKNLERSNRELEEQAKLKASIVELNDQMRGDLAPAQLGSNVLNFLVDYLDSQLGVFYIADGNDTLKSISTYAHSKSLIQDVKFGEGLVGQTALEKKTVVIKDIPEKYFEINSSLGKTKPRNIILAPILYEEKINGILEIGSINNFSDSQVNFLEAVNENIGINLNGTLVRVKMKELLEESQQQAEELQSQQEELRVSNEELEELAGASKDT